jgi:DME family drug/metabolite transporter
VAFWRAALAVALLGAGTLLVRREVWRLASAADAARLLGFGVVGVGVFYSSFQLATYQTSVAVAVILLYSAPAFVAVGARFLLGEALTRGRVAAVAVVMAGVWLTTLGAAGARVHLDAGGVAWGFAAALSYSAYYLFGKRYLPRYGVLRTLLFSLLSGTAVLAPAAALAGSPPRLDYPVTAWVLLLALALGGTLLANGLYYWGLTRIDASRAAVVASAEPAVSALLAALLLGQALLPVGWLGVGLVALGAAAPWQRVRRAR